MDNQPSNESPRLRAQLTGQRGNFYFGLGFVLLAGLLVLAGVGFFGIATLGLFSLGTAMAMAGIAITLVAAVSFVTLVTLRRTLQLVGSHETTLAGLSARVEAAQRSAAAAVPAPVAAQRAAVVVPMPSDPFQGGQVHAVRDIEGIGAHYGQLLDGLGLRDTRQLWGAEAAPVAAALKVPTSAVEGWQRMAELMAVTGIGKQYAELLVRADVRSIYALAATAPEELLERILRLPKTQGNTIGIKAVQGWVSAAQAHRGLLPFAVMGA